jgi:hypothetical protein
MKQWLLALTWLALGSTAFAGVVEADPNKDYAITPEAGPWMVCATSYVGPEAQQLAHELVLEIRSRFSLPAYVVNKGDDERRKQLEEYQRKQKEHPDVHIPFRHTRVEDQCAVLIGGYKDMDSAHRALKDIKKLSPPSSPRLMPILTEVGPDESSGAKDKAVVKGGFVNPFVSSFVVHNPTVPIERPVTNKPDPFLKKLNAPESLSAFKCPKPWTLVVAIFQGAQAIQAEKADKPGFWEGLWNHNSGDLLEASGHNAHNLAEALRTIGYEAYVLHCRWGSVVCIGGFDSAKDPRMMNTRRNIANLKLGQNVKLLADPMPMEIPRS